LTRPHTCAPRYYSLADSITTASRGSYFYNYGSGALVGTSIGLDRPLVNILRDIQTAADPSNTSDLRTSWMPSHWQACAPWKGSNSNPGQATTQLGYGRSWVTCSDWSPSSTPPALNGVQTLSLSLMGLTGTLAASALCELNATLTKLDVSQNNLVGTLPDCIGSQPPTTVANKMLFAFFDNMVRVGGGIRACTVRASH